MLELKNRQLLILHTLTTGGSYVSCKSLSSMAKVSERTVKSDVNLLKEYANDCGCLIRSKKGYGYFIEVTNADSYNAKCRELTIWFSNVEYNKGDTARRINELCRILILQNEYITLDDLGEKLHLSRSSIKTDIKEVRSYLERANLTLRVLPGSGVRAEGRELSRRLCMLELYEVHYHEPIQMLAGSNKEYMRFFSCSDELRSTIRHCFLKTMRESGKSTCDNFSNRIVTYLVLMRNRIDMGYHIELNSSDVKLLQSFGEYHLARRVLENLNSISNYTVSEEEMISLEMLLLIWSDLPPNKNLAELYPPFYGEATRLVKLICNKVSSIWHINVCEMEFFEPELRAYLIPILMQLRFNFHQYEITGLHVHANGIKLSPLALNIAKSIAEIVNEKYSCRISGNSVNNIAVAVCSALDSIQLLYTPLKLIICSENGYTGAAILQRKILSAFRPEFFSRLDILKFYEVRGVDPDEYDFLLLNHSAYAYRYKIPFIPIQQLPTREQLDEVYRKVILSGYNLEKVYASFQFNKSWAHQSFEYTSKEEFIKLFSYRIGSEDHDVKRISQAMTSYHDTHIFNGVLTIVLNAELTRRNLFEVYLLEKSSIWEKRSLEYIVFISVDFNYNPQDVKFIELLLSSLTRHPEHIRGIAEQSGYHGLLELMKQHL